MLRFIFAISIVCFAASAFVSTSVFAQTGTLQGGRLILNNGANATTLLPAATTTTYTITLPGSNVSGLEYLANDGAGNLFWGTPVGTSGSVAAIYNNSGPQTFDEPNNGYSYIFDIVDTLGTGSALGALINVVANGPSNTTLLGLLDTARNKYTGTVTWNPAGTGPGNPTGLPDEIAMCDTATLAATGASGTAIGIKVSATGGGNNYAAITKGGSVGIGIAIGNTGTDSLEVVGNVLISGQNGLKIQEGPNACMGSTTLNGTTAVTVATTEVTATCRILLTTQSPGGTVGTPYVSLQTAGTSFQIKSTVAGDNSTVAWMILLP
jgi:hypothetical protein